MFGGTTLSMMVLIKKIEYNFGLLKNDLSEKLVTKEFSSALKEITRSVNK